MFKEYSLKKILQIKFGKIFHREKFVQNFIVRTRTLTWEYNLHIWKIIKTLRQIKLDLNSSNFWVKGHGARPIYSCCVVLKNFPRSQLLDLVPLFRLDFWSEMLMSKKTRTFHFKNIRESIFFYFSERVSKLFELVKKKV